MPKGHSNSRGQSAPRPGTPAGNNKSNQSNPTSPPYYSGRGLPVPTTLPTGPKPSGK